MIPDWVDHYIDGTNQEYKNKSFVLIKKKSGEFDNLPNLLKEVIRKCSIIDNTFNKYSFKELKIVVVNEYGFKALDQNSKYKYVIYIPQFATKEKEELVKHKIAHEFAHFLFFLQGKNFVAEEIECNKKAAEWGFSAPEINE